MKLAVFGSTGRTGLEVVKQALERGHSVTAFVRNPERLTIAGEGLSTVTGDVFDPDSVAETVQGKDAVICVLGQGNDIKKTSVRTEGTKNIINEMQKLRIPRLVAVTAMGIGESWNTLSLVNKLFFATVLKNARDDHEGQEAVIKKSDLE
jgi:putative NADH-flavin reductase